MSETSPTATAYHGARHIIASGRAVVSYGAPPLVLAGGSDVLIVPLSEEPHVAQSANCSGHVPFNQGRSPEAYLR